MVDAPAEVLGALDKALADCQQLTDGKGQLDFAMVFTKSQTALTKEFRRLEKLLAPAGMLWVSWPKKSSGQVTDLDENIVRGIGLAGGLVDVKVCAMTEIWSGLKFVRRVKDR